MFKARWQGQELSRDSVVKALAKTPEPIGDVDVEAALQSEMFDSMGLAPNKQEEIEGAGGGCYERYYWRLDFRTGGCSQGVMGWGSANGV